MNFHALTINHQGALARHSFGSIHLLLFVFFLGLFHLPHAYGGNLPRTIQEVKPSIVGVGTFQKTRSPSLNFLGTGFAVGDGTIIATNAHVVPDLLNIEEKETLVVLVARNNGDPELRSVTQVAVDKEHDITLLRVSGSPLTAMKLGDSNTVQEGQMFAFTGFPIGMVLGFHPVTHRGMLSCVTPVVLPALSSKRLDTKMLARLRRSAYPVFQIDGTAYPGNSGSPLYDQDTGVVYGIINMVFVKGTKESALSQPTGITYAIPGNYISELLKGK